MAKKEKSLSLGLQVSGSPHQGIQPRDGRDRFTIALLDALWMRYRQRVSYVQDYERVVEKSGATFHNDHIAFRTIASQRPTTGIVSLSRIFEALGYEAAGCYRFPDKHLAAIHYQHPSAGFPKLFITELRTWELEDASRKTLLRYVHQHRNPLTDKSLAALHSVENIAAAERQKLLKTLTAWFHSLPWPAPKEKDVQAVNAATQFGAWVLVHGYNVNHFTALVNSHGPGPLDSIDKTVKALQGAGVPMKEEIEGVRGSKLRQTATAAVVLDVPITRGASKAKMPWTYAYFEIAERGTVRDAETGKKVPFQGFLGPQATQLFEMTRVKKS